MHSITDLLQQIQGALSSDVRWLPAVLAVLLLVTWPLGWYRQRQYSRQLLSAVQESTPSAVRSIPRWRPGFYVEFLLPPAPYRSLAVEYLPPHPLNPVAMLRALMGRPIGRVTLCGRLQQPPSAELAWMRSGLPNQAFHKETNAAAWVYRALPALNSQYATRGTNVEPLIRAFIEFQARFSPLIQRFCIQRDATREVDVLITTAGLGTNIFPHLVASVWGLGRAALHQ